MIANDSEMNEAVFAALCSCLGVAPGADAANRLIHKAYIEPENAPQFNTLCITKGSLG